VVPFANEQELVVCFGGKVMLRTMAVCLVCVSGGLFTLLGVGVSAADPNDLAAVKAEMIRLTNAERAKENLQPLVEDARLSKAAQKYTDLMAEKQILDHNIGGSTPGQRVDAEKYDYGAVGEIIYRAGQKEEANAAKAIRSWMTSTDGHREVLLRSKYTHIGVGVAYSSTGAPYLTEVFARPID
jgi:uncharacterized protein YkwD